MSNSPRESISSPRVHQRLPPLIKGASSAPCSPGQPAKPDRTADFAAVRNLAESYGVDLLPLEMGFTPLRTQAKAADKAAQLLSTADSATDLPNTPEVGETAAAAAASRGLAQAYSDGSASGHDAACVQSPRPRPQSPRKAPAAGPAATDGAQDAGRQAAPAGLGCFPIDVDGSEANTDSPYAEADMLEGEGSGSILYLDEEHLPVEERVTLLEEERDMLVDKLLSTTEALHASEARNRQSEASQGQVHALLEQLQELLRRAEVERDRAKLQLKRHRASNSQFLFPALPALGANAAAQDAFAIGSLGPAASTGGQAPEGVLTVRPRSKKYKVSVGGAPPTAENSSTSTAAAASADLFPAAGAARESCSDAATAAAPAGEGSGSADGACTAASAAQGPVSAGGAQAQQKPSQSSVAGLGTWGSRRGSRDSSCDSSDAVSPACTPEPVVTLTPSTDEARPPVSSVVRGFEALLNRRRTPWGSSGGRSGRELQLSARSSGSGSRSASPMTSRGGVELPAAAAVQAEAEAEAADAEAADAAADAMAAGLSLSPAVAMAPCDSPAGAAAQPAPAEPSPAGPEAAAAGAEAACKDAEAVSEQGGLSAQSSEVLRRTYVDAAVAGAQAERSRRSLAGGSARAPTSARTPGAGSTSSSAATTPTAAALHNAVPVGSYMLDSSCFSEEEEAVSGGGALLQAAARASTAGPQAVYDPSRFTPVQPVDPGFASTTDGGSPAGPAVVLPGVKRGRSSSPAASPTGQQQQHGLTSRSSPGSGFGSVISCEADSPGGSVTQSPAPSMSSPGAGGYSNGGGSSRGKARSASRLGMASSPATAVPTEPHSSVAASKQQQGHKAGKAQGQQQASGSGAPKSGSGGGGSGSKKHSPWPSVDAAAGADLAASAASGGKSVKAAPSPSVRGKQGSKKPAAPASRQEPPDARTGSTTTSSSTGGARAQAGSRVLPLILLAAALVLSALVAAFVWLRSQARLAAMQAQLQQLQRQLSEASAECPSGLGAPGEL